MRAMISKHPILFNADCQNSQSGYTLLQVAIALVVIGVLMAPMISSYNLYKKNQKIAQTAETIQTVTTALQTFRDINGFYPCPAPLKTPRSLVGYGTATACLTDPAITGLASGACDSVAGICIEQAFPARAATLAALTPPASPRVIVGALPFRTLQLDESQALDLYGTRLVYAITESMTDLATINDSNGAISVRKIDGTPLLTPDGSATFFIYSPGENGLGGYGKEGALIAACAGVGADTQNCTDGFEDGNTTADAVYISDVQNDAPGAAFFDDATGYFSDRNNPMWRRTTADPEVIEDLSPNAVGIGRVSSAISSAMLDIAPNTGDVAALWARDQGTGPLELSGLHVQRVCKSDQTSCFEPSVLAGDPDLGTGGMKCAAGFMVGIENGNPICDNISFTCPPGKILTGIAANGQPQCGNRPQPNCPAATKTECGVTISLSPVASGAWSTWSGNLDASQGGCKKVRYQCNAGTWGSAVANNASYPCSFTPQDINLVTGLSCAAINPGYTGTYSTWQTTKCTGGTTSNTSKSTDCTCVGASVPQTQACSVVTGNPNLTGMATRTVTYNSTTCLPDNPGWDTSACTCTPPAQTVITSNGPACGGLFTGYQNFVEKTFNPDPTICAYQVTNASLPGNCACPLTEQTSTLPHPCANPACESSVVPDTWVQAIDASTCTPTGTPTLGTPPTYPDGYCAPNALSWGYDYPAPSGSSAIVSEGSSCQCSDKTSNRRVVCSTATGIGVCKCG